MLISRDRLGDDLRPDLVHEFFHILEHAHNWGGTFDLSDGSSHWYVEASAEWAQWYYSAALGYGTEDPYRWFSQRFQADDESLLQSRNGLPRPHQYASWVWPLFQSTERGPSNVFATWSAAETANGLKAFDDVLQRQLSFQDTFRDFAVRNLEPYEYSPPESSGLNGSAWRQTPQARLRDFPVTPHELTAKRALRLSGLNTAAISQSASVSALAAQYDRYVLMDPRIRQVKIDISKLRNTASADLDVVGRLPAEKGGSADPWRRVKSVGKVLTLCRDYNEENFNLLYVVISNHSSARAGNGPNLEAALDGSYTVTAKDRCDVPTGYTGTISASVHYTNGGPDASVVAKVNYRYVGSFQTFSCANAPDADRLVYCYQFTGGVVRWDQRPWSDGNCKFTSIEVRAKMRYPGSPGHSFGRIQILRRYSDYVPDLTSSYEIEQGWPEDVHMRVSAAPVHPDNDKCTEEPGYTETGPPENLAPEIVPGQNLVPNVEPAGGWNISGGATAHFPGANYDYSWTLTATYASK